MAPPLPSGYRREVSIGYPATVGRISAEDGSLAASGYAVEYGGVFIFDRIVTEAAHRRRGLGGAMMAALASRQQSNAAQRVLVATADGRALYSTLDWTVPSPNSKVTIGAGEA
ncbi:GNAT family N-acetyltransferase [Janthinobacterium fluminis]|uniref:GNAT family N-acetyltransferase n=1 Tax=Janthinobacterium fluminis TaxID=2987524 RepID=A0ABT5K4Z5_9BURK|nr:GNAT family N-acetyltransferase [Janthinobacterium fluminis]MDC8759994.1 GNAT family N-acetyltransferase [Janthinobacterium fluminis]